MLSRNESSNAIALSGWVLASKATRCKAGKLSFRLPHETMASNRRGKKSNSVRSVRM